ncbi:MAG: diacylglycerol kinase family lipid kinase [Bacteroidales bacterium]|nr:diacylglycerol kinase family lipid kinase [Bacteroidales bacterium]
MKKRILFVINPKSGTGRYRRVPQRVARFLDKEQFDYEICYTEYRGHATELAAQAVREGVSMVVSVGGDGTLNEIVQALAGTGTSLAIFPTGSGNGLAHHMHLPFNLKRSVQLLNRDHEERIDTVSLNGYVYASIAGVGFDAFVAERYSHVRHRGFFPYLHIVLSNYFRYRPRTYCLTDGEKTVEVKALLVTFANSSQWGFDVKISPEASVQDGLVNVTVVQKPPLYALPRVLLFLFSGNLNRVKKYVKIYKMQHSCVKSKDEKPLYAHLDGDFIGMQPQVEMQVRPLSLQMVLKQTY